MKILVDVEEQRSSVPSCLEALGVSVDVVRLPVGDYVTEATAVERKTVADLHESLINGRIWSQLHALRCSGARASLVVEGQDLDAGRVSSRGVRGALLRIAETSVRVIRTSSPSDTALWLYLLASQDDARAGHPSARRRGRRRMVASPAGVLATVPGISARTADRLLAHFGSIAGIAAASISELQVVEEVGAKRASDLHRVLTHGTN